jgi:exosortase C (VPDSG-CTERM-specific)
MDPQPKTQSPAVRKSSLARLREYWAALPVPERSRLKRCLLFVGLVIIAFIKPLCSLMAYALSKELHSHIVLIPFTALWLLNVRWNELPRDYRTSPGWAAGFFLAGLALLITEWRLQGSAWALSRNDDLALLTFSFLCFLVSALFLALGRRWMAAATFPVAFLLFMIPLPDHWVNVLESASQAASAQMSDWYFRLVGMSFLRDDNIFQLPGITIKVAQECSGIRSSWVLFITGLVAAELFLKSPWRRAFFVALVIPLGILRNGFRILVIGWLCVNVDPGMIDSPIHHRGGPIFFALSMIPLFLLLWWLRRRENRMSRSKPGASPEGPRPAADVS